MKLSSLLLGLCSYFINRHYPEIAIFGPNIVTNMHKVISGLCLPVQVSSVAQSCLTLCDPMDCSTQGLPVHHQLPEFTQTHVHRVSDAISSSVIPSPPAPNPSQHQKY